MSRPPTTISRQPTIIYSADNVQQAHLLRSLLADEGIPALVINDAIQGAGGELPVGWAAAAKVVVAGDQAEEARRFAEGFDRKTKRRILADDDDADVEPLEAWNDWPVCQKCGERRSARCPVCGVAGTDFPLADIPDANESGQPLLLCQSCDDLILPEWYRLCARCGHDFGEGLEAKENAPVSIEISPRAVTVLVVLLLMAVGALAYFSWLFWR